VFPALIAVLLFWPQETPAKPAETKPAPSGQDVVVTAKRPRATSFDRAPTGVRGALVDGGVVPTPLEEER